ncbi:MAG: hypothetical protein RLZZ518_594, partial [Actinomycetota bacterium]
TRAATLKGWCPRPLDDGGKDFEFVGRASEIYQHLTAVTPGTLGLGLSNAIGQVQCAGANRDSCRHLAAVSPQGNLRCRRSRLH